MVEIDKEHFCAGSGEGTLCNPYEGCEGEECCLYHRKWPTPDQFEEEYGRNAVGMPFVWRDFDSCVDDWEFERYYTEMDREVNDEVVILCTPYGEPDKDWRPE